MAFSTHNSFVKVLFGGRGGPPVRYAHRGIHALRVRDARDEVIGLQAHKGQDQQ